MIWAVNILAFFLVADWSWDLLVWWICTVILWIHKFVQSNSPHVSCRTFLGSTFGRQIDGWIIAEITFFDSEYYKCSCICLTSFLTHFFSSPPLPPPYRTIHQMEHFQSSVSKSTDELNLHWKEDNPIVLYKGLKLPQYSIENFNTSFCEESFHLGEF